MPELRQFLIFAAIGAAGFLVDAGALALLTELVGLDLYSGRALSFLAAATFTWAANRALTFKRDASSDPLKEWSAFVAAMTFGGAVNYATYAYLVTYHAPFAAHPTLGVAAGSIAGLFFNFASAKFFVFRRRAPEPTSGRAQDRP